MGKKKVQEIGDEYKIVMAGAGGVGKSALTMRFIKGDFVERYDPTIEDSYKKEVEVDGVMYALDILDTAGQDEYSALRDHYLKTGWGFVLVFSVTDYPSFFAISDFREAIMRAKDIDIVPSLLVGNKCDLVKERAVPHVDGEKLAESLEYCEYIETSAKTNQNIRDMYFSIIHMVNRYFDDFPDIDPRKRKKGCILM